MSRSNDSNLVRAGKARGLVDPSVEKRCSGPGSAIALWRNKHVRARFGLVASRNSRMMRTARPLIVHALDTHTSRLSPEGISWNYDGPLLLLRSIGRNSTSTSDPNSRSHRIRLSISPRAKLPSHPPSSPHARNTTAFSLASPSHILSRVTCTDHGPDPRSLLTFANPKPEGQ